MSSILSLPLGFLLMLSLLIAPSHQQVTTSVSDSCAEASWLEWSSWTTCSDTCGSCGIQTRTRVCLTTLASCNCEGDGLDIQYCNIQVCRYPRVTCCNNLIVTTVNGTFACEANSTFVTTA